MSTVGGPQYCRPTASKQQMLRKKAFGEAGHP